jgi:hypothetical protein
VTWLSAPALCNLLEAAGFHVGARGFSFGGQYLWAEGHTNPVDLEPQAVLDGDVPSLVTQLAQRVASKRAFWAGRLPGLLASGPVALWGAGAKGGTFLNVVEGGDRIRPVIDVNPRKHGKHVTGTGQTIAAPETLVEQGAGTVIVMNPIYRDEIGDQLATLGVPAEVLVA